MARNPTKVLFGAMIVAPCLAAMASAAISTFVFPEIHLPNPELKIPDVVINVPSRGFSCYCPPVDLVLICGGGLIFDEPRVPVYGLIDLFGTVEDYKVALTADAIELVELKASKFPGAPIEEYVESTLALSSVDSAALRASLTCDATYNWSDEPDSEGRYLYRVKFKKAGRVVAVDLSLPRKSARVVKDGRVVASSSFEFGYEVVVGVLESYFPIRGKG